VNFALAIQDTKKERLKKQRFIKYSVLQYTLEYGISNLKFVQVWSQVDKDTLKPGLRIFVGFLVFGVEPYRHIIASQTKQLTLDIFGPYNVLDAFALEQYFNTDNNGKIVFVEIFVRVVRTQLLSLRCFPYVILITLACNYSWDLDCNVWIYLALSQETKL